MRDKEQAGAPEPVRHQAAERVNQERSGLSPEEEARAAAASRFEENPHSPDWGPDYYLQEEVSIDLEVLRLQGNLELPDKARGLILVVHGTSSSCYSSRNRYVARVLEEAGFGTLLFDLLTAAEDASCQNRFNIPLLTQRLIAVTRWLSAQEAVEHQPLAYFGADTGAAAALGAAATLGSKIKAVVTRGGHADLALEALGQVTAPTMLLVGSQDAQGLALNRQAYDRLQVTRELKVVPGAGELFEEPGKLEEMAALAAGWFRRYVGQGGE